MKKEMMKIVLFVFAILITTNLSAQHSLEKIWESDSTVQFVEGIVLEPGETFLFVSNTIGNPMEKDGKGTISTLDLDGKVIKHDVVTGMNAPKDIQRFINLIYAADLNEVVVVDIDKKEIVQRIVVDGATLLHNIAIHEKGIVYVSDMFAGINLYNAQTGIMYMSTDQHNTVRAYKLK